MGLGIYIVAFFLTCSAFAAGYELLRQPVQEWVYAWVLSAPAGESRSASQLDPVLITLPIFFCAGWVVMAALLARLRAFLFPPPAPELAALWVDLRDDVSATAYQPPALQFAPPARKSAGELYSLSPAEFEERVAAIINLTTPYKAVVTGGAGDGGVDVRVYNGRRLVGIVQCKRYKPDTVLPPGHVRELYAVKQQLGVKIAYLATTARVSRATLDEARRLGIRVLAGENVTRAYERARAAASLSG